jgi:hypothetical protein
MLVKTSVVYSFEVPGEIKLLPLPDEEFEKGKTTELSPFDDFRVRILPVLGMHWHLVCHVLQS